MTAAAATEDTERIKKAVSAMETAFDIAISVCQDFFPVPIMSTVKMAATIIMVKSSIPKLP